MGQLAPPNLDSLAPEKPSPKLSMLSPLRSCAAALLLLAVSAQPPPCATGATASQPAASCAEVHAHCGSSIGVFWVQPPLVAAPYRAACAAGGWALALKIDGRQSTFAFSSPYWTDGALLAPDPDAVGSLLEAKLQPFLDMPGTEVMLVMATNSSSGAPLTLGVVGGFASLRALFSGGFVATTADLASWYALMPGAGYQTGWSRQGFNNIDDGRQTGYGDDFHAYRIGILFDDSVYVGANPDAAIGIGSSCVWGTTNGYYDANPGYSAGAFYGCCGVEPSSTEYQPLPGTSGRALSALVRVYVRGPAPSATPSSTPTSSPSATAVGVPVFAFLFDGDTSDAMHVAPALIATAPQPFVAGVRGAAAYLNAALGSYLYSIVPLAALPTGNGPRTIAVWARPEALYGYAMLASWGLPENALGSVLGIGNVFGFYGYNCDLHSADFGISAAAANAVTPLGVWTHIAFTYDGSFGAVYVNGSIAFSGTLFGGALNTQVNTRLFVNDGPGGPGAGWIDTPQLTGAIDELLIYSRALSSAEISTLMSQGPSVPSSTPTNTPSPTALCVPSLFRTLPRTDLVGDLVISTSGASLAAPSLQPSETSCRLACCDAPACDGFTFAASELSISATGSANCFLFVNVTQLIPSNLVVSSIRTSVL